MKIKIPNLPGNSPAKRSSKLKLKAAIARSPSRREVDDDADDPDEPGSEMKLSHAFVVVLVLHVIAVGGVFAFNSIKSRHGADASASLAPAQTSSATPDDTRLKDRTKIDPAATKPIEPRPAGSAPLPQLATASSGSKTHEVRPGDTLTRIASLYGVSIAALEKENAITDPTALKPGKVLRIPAPGPAVADKPASKQPATRAVSAATTTTAKPATTASQTPSAPKEPANVYTVVKGDNPVSIARKLKVSYSALLSANHIEDPRKLQIGQKLKIPTKSN